MASLTYQPSDETASASQGPADGTSTDTATGGFPAKSSAGVVISVSAGSLSATDPVVGTATARIEYTTNGGSSWSTLAQETGGGSSSAPYSITVTSAVSLDQLDIRAYAYVNDPGATGGGSASASFTDWEITARVPLGIIDG